MRLGIGALFSLIAICCAGCASQPAAPIVSTVAPRQAKIVLTRSDQGPYIFSSSVQIDANGKHLIDLAPGQSYTGGVAPGSVTLTATVEMDMGQYKIEDDVHNLSHN